MVHYALYVLLVIPGNMQNHVISPFAGNDTGFSEYYDTKEECVKEKTRIEKEFSSTGPIKLVTACLPK